MALTEIEKAHMCAATRDAAVALLDDLNFVRTTVTKPMPTQGDVRLMSGVLRRLLLESHLTIVAGPRVGRVKIPIYDSTLDLDADGRDFVSCGLAPIYGWGRSFFTTFSAQLHGEAFIAISPDEAVIRHVTCDALLNDRIARLEAQWVTRKDALEFICYYDFGVHFTGRDEKPQFAAVRRFRNAITFCARAPHPLVLVRQDLETDRPHDALLDLAQAHTFSTAYFLSVAPDVIALARLIEAEIAGRNGAAENRPD